MGRFDSERFHRLVEFLHRSGGVGKCLPYPDMTPIPAGFNEMEVLWDDLSGNSTKLWPEVRDIVMRSWGWLDAHQLQLTGDRA